MYQQFALHPFVFISLTQYECLFIATECPGFTFGFTGARSGIGPVEPTRPKKRLAFCSAGRGQGAAEQQRFGTTLAASFSFNGPGQRKQALDATKMATSAAQAASCFTAANKAARATALVAGSTSFRDIVSRFGFSISRSFEMALSKPKLS